MTAVSCHIVNSGPDVRRQHVCNSGCLANIGNIVVTTTILPNYYYQQVPEWNHKIHCFVTVLNHNCRSIFWSDCVINLFYGVTTLKLRFVYVQIVSCFVHAKWKKALVVLHLNGQSPRNHRPCNCSFLQLEKQLTNLRQDSKWGRHLPLQLARYINEEYMQKTWTWLTQLCRLLYFELKKHLLNLQIS